MINEEVLLALAIAGCLGTAICFVLCLAFISESANKSERIKELQARLDAVLGIKYHTHPSWNCGKDFDDGWNACRKQMDDCIAEQEKQE